MNKVSRDHIDRIMGDAFTRAADVLEAEFRKLLDAHPDRYSRFVLAVGWGPTLFDANGKIVETYQPNCCARARRLLTYSYEFYDRFGADNRQVYPTAASGERAAA